MSKAKHKVSFGTFAKQARLAKGFGLRQVAREMKISAAYLSRVENDIETPSGELIAKMARWYGVPIEDLTEKAIRPRASAAAHGHAMQASPELRALYRLGAELDSQVVEEIIRDVLRKEGTTEAEIEKKLSSLKSELPRIANSTRDGLFAAEATPWFLTKAQIAGMAYEMLDENGIGHGSYKPPTPIERIVENQPGVLYRIEKLKCDKRGNPLVLGLTGWSETGERQIVVNSVLADSDRKSDGCRFNFTLAHELFHATEHLPRVSKDTVAPLNRMRIFVDASEKEPHSAAERAVHHWSKNQAAPHRLTTDEDWREWQSNTFASALLMPDWAVKFEFMSRIGAGKVLGKSGSNLKEVALETAGERAFGADVHAESLADLFAVSRQAMAIRLLQLALVQEGNA